MCSPPRKNSKALIMEKETVLFTKAGKGVHMTLKFASPLHIIAHLNMHSKTKIPLKCFLERVMNTCVGTLPTARYLTAQLCALYLHQESS